jgi:hypothetical protein
MTKFVFSGSGHTVGGGGWLLAIVAGVVLLASSGAAAAISEFVTILLAVAGGVVALVLTAGAWLLVRMHRRGAFAPVVSWRPQELPAPEPRRAVAAPQELHIHLHGSETEQARQIAAIRQAGYQAWEQREHNER